MYCRNCGCELREKQMFCTKCGTKVMESENIKKKSDSNKQMIIVILCLLFIVFVVGISIKLSNEDDIRHEVEEEYEDDEFDKYDDANEADSEKIAQILEQKDNSDLDDKELYQRFLNNEEVVYYKEKPYYLHEIKGLVQSIYCTEIPEELGGGIEEVYYGFIDCGLDGKEELVLEYRGNGDFVGEIEVIIFKQDNQLVCVDDLQSVYRSYEDVSYSGIVYSGGSGGAWMGATNMDLYTQSGEKVKIFDGEYYYDMDRLSIEICYPELENVYNVYEDKVVNEGKEFGCCFYVYTIRGKNYYSYDSEDGKSWWIDCLRQQGVNVYTMEEMDVILLEEITSSVGDKTLAERILFSEKQIDWRVCETENKEGVNEDTSAENGTLLDPDQLFELFIAGNIEGYYSDGTSFRLEDCWDESFDELRCARVDLDNDGEKELIVYNYYGGCYLDARDGKIYLLDAGDGTAATIGYVVFDDKTWIVHSDATHAGREMHDFTLYDGEGRIVDEFGLYKEYWEYPNEPDGPNTIYTYRGNQISKEEYDMLYNKIFLE